MMSDLALTACSLYPRHKLSLSWRPGHVLCRCSAAVRPVPAVLNQFAYVCGTACCDSGQLSMAMQRRISDRLSGTSCRCS
jgi:hypothetical protein